MSLLHLAVLESQEVLEEGWMVESIFNNETTQKCHVSVTFIRDVIECGRVVSRVCSGISMFGVWDLVCI